MSFNVPYARVESGPNKDHVGGPLRKLPRTQCIRTDWNCQATRLPAQMVEAEDANCTQVSMMGANDDIHVSSNAVKMGFQTITTQLSQLVDTVMRLENSNQALWRRFDVLSRPSTEKQNFPISDVNHTESTCPSPGDLRARPRAPSLLDSSELLAEGHTPYPRANRDDYDDTSPANLPYVRVTCSETEHNHNGPVIYLSKSASQSQTLHDCLTPSLEDTTRDTVAPVDESCRSTPRPTPSLTTCAQNAPFDAKDMFRGPRICQKSISIGTSDFALAQTHSTSRTSSNSAIKRISRKEESQDNYTRKDLSVFRRRCLKEDELNEIEEEKKQLERDRILNRCNNRGNSVLKINSSSESTTRASQPGFKSAYDKPMRRIWNDEIAAGLVNVNLCSSSSSSSLISPPMPKKRHESSTTRRSLFALNSSTTPVGAPSVTISHRSPTIQRREVKYELTEAQAHHAELINMVMDELASTEKSYVHALSQFLLLRNEVFAPNKRIDRAKFIRLFPATIDSLYKIHKESLDLMQMRNTYENDRGMSFIRMTMCGGRMERVEEKGGVTYCPFIILLDMIDGKRPIACSSQNFYASNCRRGIQPMWKDAPFFQLYMRYLNEFAAAMQMLAKMRRSSNLKRYLKKLQMNPVCEYRDITAYLLAPVQRLPRYLLLVKKMIHYTKKMKLDRAKSQRDAIAKPGLRACSTITSGQRSKHCSSSSFSSTSGTGTHPQFLPSLETLMRAESALHGMLLELDRRIGSDMNNQTSNQHLMVGRNSFSNSCSDSMGSRISTYPHSNFIGHKRTQNIFRDRITPQIKLPHHRESFWKRLMSSLGRTITAPRTVMTQATTMTPVPDVLQQIPIIPAVVEVRPPSNCETVETDVKSPIPQKIKSQEALKKISQEISEVAKKTSNSGNGVIATGNKMMERQKRWDTSVNTGTRDLGRASTRSIGDTVSKREIRKSSSIGPIILKNNLRHPNEDQVCIYSTKTFIRTPNKCLLNGANEPSAKSATQLETDVRPRHANTIKAGHTPCEVVKSSQGGDLTTTDSTDEDSDSGIHGFSPNTTVLAAQSWHSRATLRGARRDARRVEQRRKLKIVRQTSADSVSSIGSNSTSFSISKISSPFLRQVSLAIRNSETSKDNSPRKPVPEFNNHHQRLQRSESCISLTSSAVIGDYWQSDDTDISQNRNDLIFA